jgi:hypothetical protein
MNEPQWIYTQMRRPSRDGEDPGAVEEGYFFAENGKVISAMRMA